MSKIDEKEAVAKLAEYLRKLSPYKIWYRTNYVLRSPEFFPTQPEIDLIICRVKEGEKVPPILAAEVKYIRATRDGHINLSYYSGLDEALALLVLGFDKVMLIHLVEERVLSAVFLNYVRLLSNMIKSLGLPLGYRVYVLALSSDLYIYKTIRLGAGDVYNLEGLWVSPTPNPLLKDKSSLGETVRRNRRLLVSILGIKDVYP